MTFILSSRIRKTSSSTSIHWDLYNEKAMSFIGFICSYIILPVHSKVLAFSHSLYPLLNDPCIDSFNRLGVQSLPVAMIFYSG